uniref:VOC domain-containing protein n=1 Tax=Poecilia reticulata TaxID=8081 RepID=A0A3P9NYK9_POERE
MALRRALHFVFKVGDRAKTATFYRDVLGMKVPAALTCQGG